MLTIKAEVVSQPCSLRPGDENIQVDFGTLINKDLLHDGRILDKNFKIHLEDCTPEIAKNVRVTFTGKGAAEDGSVLALAENSLAKGIGIGFKHAGKVLPLNQASRPMILATGSNLLDFSAYVKLLPSSNNSLEPGAFTASANFILNYD
ncbi:TPA: type 1 fimbrial protein [Aeromonas hydrophila]|nr:type 1 fimbrial protein [Aeromonas hydrophila]